MAIKNIFFFSMSAKEASSVNKDNIDEFLLAACQQYLVKLSDAPQAMYFYAWHDEMAGQLRTSAAPANCAEELPFSCRLNVVELPTTVSVEFLNSNYLDGISLTECDEYNVDNLDEHASM